MRLVDELAALGVDKPVLPGIMPITNASQVRRMAELSGAPIPGWLVDRLDGVDDPAEVRRSASTSPATLCAELLDAGAPGLHLYTLNRSTASREIYANLGLGARAERVLDDDVATLDHADAARRGARRPRPQANISRVPYLPGLDGMRALAVVAVMVYHANTPGCRAGSSASRCSS